MSDQKNENNPNNNAPKDVKPGTPQHQAATPPHEQSKAPGSDTNKK